MKQRLQRIFCFFAFLLFCHAAFAQDLESVLRGLLDNKTFEKNRSFIMGGLFRNPQLYYDEYGIDYPKVLAKLKDNGLLKLSTTAPRAFRVHFEASDAPMFVTRSVQSALKSLGYYYATPIRAEFVDGNYQLVMLMNAESALDPVSFIAEIEKYGYRVGEIKRDNDTSWRYALTLRYPKIPEAISLDYDVEVVSGNLKGEYWYLINRQEGSMHFNAIDSNRIYPEVAMYDGSLKLIRAYKLRAETGQYFIEVPKGVMFVRVSDQFTPSNIKAGIKMMLQR